MACVLIVDDDPAVLQVLEEVVRAYGYTTILASSGEEALRRLEGVDAAITDYSMPGMDGVTLLRTMRKRGSTFPVIMLSGSGSERMAREAGAYRYFTKPCDMDELSLVLDRALHSPKDAAVQDAA